MTEQAQPFAVARRVALWLALAVLIAGAVLGAVFIVIGDQANIAGRAWLTLILVAAFAGAVVIDTRAGDGPNTWYLAASTILNSVLVVIGLLKLWNGFGQPADTGSAFVWGAQFWWFLGVILVLRLALLFTQLYVGPFVQRTSSTPAQVAAVITIATVWLGALVLALPAAFPAWSWPEWWWRVAAAALLVAVVCAVIPVIVRAMDPKAAAEDRARREAHRAEQLQRMAQRNPYAQRPGYPMAPQQPPVRQGVPPQARPYQQAGQPMQPPQTHGTGYAPQAGYNAPGYAPHAAPPAPSLPFQQAAPPQPVRPNPQAGPAPAEQAPHVEAPQSQIRPDGV